jgi:hypothetical protein
VIQLFLPAIVNVMARAVSLVLMVLMAGLWISGGLRHQKSVGPEESTVQAQITALAQPTPTPTP